MTLHEKQVLFVKNFCKLVDFISSKEYQVTFGEAYRTPQQAQWNAEHGTGIAHSLHTQRLAIDINLFDSSGVYITDKKSYQQFGDYWKSLHPFNRWGGDFVHLVDSNHFEMQDI